MYRSYHLSELEIYCKIITEPPTISTSVIQDTYISIALIGPPRYPTCGEDSVMTSSALPEYPDDNRILKSFPLLNILHLKYEFLRSRLSTGICRGPGIQVSRWDQDAYSKLG